MPTVVLAPTRSVPRSMPRICAITSAASSRRASVRQAYSYSTWPASVSLTRLPSRSSRNSPSTASSSFTWYDTEGWLMLSSWAAALKLSCSATARKVRSWCSVRVLSSASVSAIRIPGSTIGQVTDLGGRDVRGAVPARTTPPAAVAIDRVHALLDPGSFVELDRSAAGRAPGAGRENGAVPADGVVVGTGTVDGRDVAIFALDPAVLGGSLGAVTAAKIVKV